MDLSQLPSTFYRVTAKALIFDTEGRLLLGVNDEGGYELPGGGLEHGETFTQCLKRELDEELGLVLKDVGEVVAVYSMRSPRRRVPVIRILAHAVVETGEPKPGDSIVTFRYVTKDEFVSLDLVTYEGAVQDFADRIWPAKLT